MGRSKRNKIFDLFKTGFKITFFYKPTMEFNDEYYYVILDDTIELRIKVINNVAVIDTVKSLSQSYVKPLFDKIVTLIMEQSNLSVIVSIIGDTGVLHQACSNHGAPLIEDDQFVTVSKGFYNKWKAHTNDVSKYGFYLLSVSDDEPQKVEQPKSEQISDTKSEKPPIETKKLIEPKDNRFDKIKSIIHKDFPNMTFDIISKTNLQCSFSEDNFFNMEIVDDILYIKNLMQTGDQSINFVKLMMLVNCFESAISIIPDIFIINVTNVELHRICDAKRYMCIDETHKLPLNNLFKQAFQGFGSYKITINH